MYKLKDIFSEQITGEWGSECATNQGGTYVLRTTNFTNEGIINFDNVVKRNIADKKIKTKQLKLGDIILEKSGGSDNIPVGRVVYCDENIEKHIFLCNNFTQAMRVNTEIANPRYIFYYMYFLHKVGATSLLQSKTTGIRNLQLKSYLNQKVPLPNLDKQRKIVNVLDRVTQLIEYNRKQISLLDLLVKSRYLVQFFIKQGYYNEMYFS